MKPNPLIGITDFTSSDQVAQMLDVLKNEKPAGSNWRLHVGIMMSRNRLLDQPIERDWEKPILSPVEFQHIFCHWDGLYNCIHYADPKHKEDLEFEKHLYMLRLSGGMFLHGIQLDLDWPDPVAVAEACKGLCKTEIILQIGTRAFREIGDDVDRLVKKLGDYDGIVHRVLLDKSMGKGIGMNAKFLLPFARAIRKHFPELAIGFAGGLSATSMNLLKPVLEEFPDCDQDAQGGLRPSKSYLDPIDLEICRGYIIESLKLRK